MAKVISVNISEKKGTIKKPVPFIEINEEGVKNDAHSGPWHRQVSLLANESVEKFSKEANRKIAFGEFAENITTSGIVLHTSKPLDRIAIGDVILEVTQIGKECHGTSCAIFREVGNCVMPKEGIFCRVITGGKIKAEDELIFQPKVFRAVIITLSDRAFRGDYEDLSGPRVAEHLQNYFSEQNREFEFEHFIIPDESEKLESLVDYAVNADADILITTGGTGISQRDITPEVLLSLMDKELPGIMDFIRNKYGAQKMNALVSRSVAGTIAGTLVFALPGSVKAVNEYMNEINLMLGHLIAMINNLDTH
ncbi:MAG: molybdenum cofactor synthesis domain-containing protein [Bacteroidota bacterium]